MDAPDPTHRPEPMTPPDCDLRGLPFMPLDVARFIDSDLYALSTGDQFKAAVTLYCKAFQQVPAASLPDDARILARLSGAGPRWARLKDMALRGWVKCSDGRLYHPVVAEKAREAWKARLAQRARAAKRWSGGAGNAHPDGSQPANGGGGGSGSDGTGGLGPAPSDDAAASPAAHPAAHAMGDPAAHPAAMQGTGTGTGTGKEYTSSLREDAPSSPAERPPPDARTALWTEGLARLRRLTGKPDKAARGLLGKLCRNARDDCALVGSVLFEAEQQRPGDPVPWLEAAIRTRTGERESRRKSTFPDWALEEMGLLTPKEPETPAFDFDSTAEEVP